MTYTGPVTPGQALATRKVRFVPRDPDVIASARWAAGQAAAKARTAQATR